MVDLRQARWCYDLELRPSVFHRHLRSHAIIFCELCSCRNRSIASRLSLARVRAAGSVLISESWGNPWCLIAILSPETLGLSASLLEARLVFSKNANVEAMGCM